MNPEIQSVLNNAGQDKFLLVLSLPPALRAKKTEDPTFTVDHLQMSVYGAVVPPISVPPIVLPYAGQNLPVSSHVRAAYQPLTVNYIVDNAFKNYWILSRWLHLLNTERDSLYDGSHPTTDTLPEYMTYMSVYGLNEYNQKAIEFKYINCFITDIGAIMYDYRNTETFISSTATFSYSQIETNLIEAP